MFGSNEDSPVVAGSVDALHATATANASVYVAVIMNLLITLLL